VNNTNEAFYGIIISIGQKIEFFVN